MNRIVYKGLIYDRNGLRKSTVIIEDGIIARIYDGIVDISGEIVLDYSNYNSIVAFPGFIDLHIHLRDFNYAYKETIESGTKAAVHGGITIVGDMPNTSPRIDNQSVLSKRIKLFKEKSYTDFYIYVDVSIESISDIEDMLKNPHVAGIKLYPDKYYVLANESIFHLLKKYDKLLIVHPEEPYLINIFEEELIEQIIKRDYHIEAIAVNHIGLASEIHGLKRVHFTHVTNLYSVLLSKRYGYTVDTCPHYLMFSYERIFNNCKYKVLPPLRTEAHRSLLFNMLLSGNIDAVSSDHAPHGVLEKTCCPMTCPPGINGVEITAIYLGHLYSLGYLGLKDIYELLVFNPSRILNLKHYGNFSKGIRGNISIVNFGCTTCIKPDILYTRAKYSVYDNMCFKSCIEATIVGGVLVYHRLKGTINKPNPVSLNNFS